ncbi:MAG: hypothetical protein Q9186_003365 [Xanthomendoza sp. 1 TL-2023]
MSTLHRRPSAPWTRLFCLLAAFLLVGCLQNAIVSASPTQLIGRQDNSNGSSPGTPENEEGSSPAPLEDKYPKLDECREKCSVAKDKSLFYSQVGKFEDIPTDFAKEDDLTLVRESYPPGFTDKIEGSTGYLRFAKDFSKAFAEKTSGIAYVLLPTDGTSLKEGKTWSKIEYPALTDEDGECTRILKVDPDDFKKRCILWDRDGNEDDDDTYSKCKEANGPVPPGKSSGT